MAKKPKKTSSKTKPSVKVQDLKSQQNPKGGAVDAFRPIDPLTSKIGVGSVLPTGLNINKFHK